MWLSPVYMPHSLLTITLCVFVCVCVCLCVCVWQRKYFQSSLCQEWLFGNNSVTDVEWINCVFLKIQIAVIYQLIKKKHFTGTVLSCRNFKSEAAAFPRSTFLLLLPHFPIMKCLFLCHKQRSHTWSGSSNSQWLSMGPLIRCTQSEYKSVFSLLSVIIKLIIVDRGQ